MSELISYSEALTRIRSLAGLMGTPRRQDLPLSHCLGRRLAADLVAPIASPPFTNASMDGYALRHGDLALGDLKVLGTRLAGEPQSLGEVASESRGCLKIMTGAPLPTWADTVVPVEKTMNVAVDQIQVQGAWTLGANIRQMGEDFAPGTLLLRKGATIRPEDVMVAAALGLSQLPVAESLRIRCLSTGSELVEPGQDLKPGLVYNSSQYFLMAAAQSLGLRDVSPKTLDDTPEAVRTWVMPRLADDRPTLIISTGAVSAGDADFIPSLAADLGFATLFHKVAIRPGKPVYLGLRGNTVWLGLPGNPISTAVGWYFFARPLLHVLGCAQPLFKQRFVLRNDVVKPQSLRCFYRAEVSEDGKNVWIGSSQGSAHFAPSLNMGAYVELPEGRSRLVSGETVYGVRIS